MSSADYVVTFLIAVCTLLIAIFVLCKRKARKNFPPGPRGLPVVGYLPFIRGSPATTYMKLAGKYGPVFSVDVGMETNVVLNSYETIYEAAVKRGNVFAGRPFNHLQYCFTHGLGLSFRDFDKDLKTQRKFGYRTLKEFGMGKKQMEDKIIEEVRYLCEVISDKNGRAFNCMDVISNAVCNVICNVVMGRRFQYDDKRFLFIVVKITRLFSRKIRIGILFLAPITRFLPYFRDTFNKCVEDVQSVAEIFRDIVEEHRKSYDPNVIEDFIDAYLAEMKKGGDRSFHDEQLYYYVVDLLFAGTQSTTNTLQYCIISFVLWPEYQKKIFEEISRSIGESGIPTMKQKEKMPYTHAFVQEIMRHRTSAPLSVGHKTTEDVSFRGYDIPKDTAVLFNLWAVNHDSSYFKDPDVFRPERFIDSDGCFIHDPRVIPFSVGSRNCIGEQLARVEIFLILSSLVQKFEIVRDPESPLPDFHQLSYEMFLVPDNFKCIFRPR